MRPRLTRWCSGRCISPLSTVSTTWTTPRPTSQGSCCDRGTGQVSTAVGRTRRKRAYPSRPRVRTTAKYAPNPRRKRLRMVSFSMPAGRSLHRGQGLFHVGDEVRRVLDPHREADHPPVDARRPELLVAEAVVRGDRKSTRLNSSHVKMSYAVFYLK